MKSYRYPDKKNWAEIIQRPVTDLSELEKKVKKITDTVKENGDKAIRKYTKKFDGVKLKEISVNEQEINQASSLLSDELKKAIRQAKKNIELFHTAQKPACRQAGEEVKKI
jgi:histidinol dehydrogenase